MKYVRRVPTMEVVRRSDGATCVISVSTFDPKLYRKPDEPVNVEPEVKAAAPDPVEQSVSLASHALYPENPLKRKRGRPPRVHPETTE